MADKIGDKIRIRRTELNMTQKELADKIFVSIKLVSKWERGGTPSINYITPLCQALKVDSTYFFESENTLGSGEPNKNKALKKKLKWSERSKKNKFLICYLPSICAFVLAVVMLSIFVFAPIGRHNTFVKNKDKYFAAMEASFDKNFTELKYYNLELKAYLDGDEDTELTKQWQGYMDENGEPAFLTYDPVYQRVPIIVKDGQRYYDGNKTDYVKPEGLNTLKDLLASQMNFNKEMDFAEDDITYVKKTSWGYSMEIDSDVFLGDLSNSTKKHLKLRDKIRAKFVIENGYFKELSLVIKYRNTKEKENFVAKTVIEFKFEKPEFTNATFVDAEGFMKVFLGENVKTCVAPSIPNSYKYQNGYYYEHDSLSSTLYRCGDDGITKHELAIVHGDYNNDKYIYNDFIYGYVARSASSSFDIYKLNILTGEEEKTTFSKGNGYYDYRSYNQNFMAIGHLTNNKDTEFFESFLIDLNDETLTPKKYYDRYVLFLDSEGNEYYKTVTVDGPGDKIQMTKDGVTYTFKGSNIYEENGKIITFDEYKTIKYLYKDNVLIQTITDYEDYIQLNDGKFCRKNGRYVYESKDNYVEIPNVELDFSTTYGMTIQGYFNGKLIVRGMVGGRGYTFCYDANDIAHPIAIMQGYFGACEGAGHFYCCTDCVDEEARTYLYYYI